MKILLITGDFPPARSGEAAHAFHLALNLAKRGMEVHVLTSAVKDVVNHPDFTVYPIMRSWSWVELPRFMGFLKRCSPDAILLLYLGAMYNYHPMITFSPTISKNLLQSVPFVTQFENPAAKNWKATFSAKVFRKLFSHTIARKGSDYIFGTLLNDSQKIIFLCGTHKKLLKEYYPQIDKKGLLIPPPPLMDVSPEDGNARAQGRALIGADTKEFLLVYFGYIYEGKGLETLLKAIKLVTQNKRKLRLMIIGGFVEHYFGQELNPEKRKYSESLYALQDSLGIGNQVVWTGHAHQDQISLFLRAADLCILPFDKEIRLNNSTFSAAAAHGLPIITTRSGGVDQQISHLENVFLCPPKDPEALANAIGSLMDSPDICKRLSTGALKLAEEWFSWEVTVKKTLETFYIDHQTIQ